MPTIGLSIDPDLQERTIVRRYIDLAKLLHLLEFQALYLRRADGFSDRLEGALFPLLRTSMDEAHAEGKLSNDADYFYRRARVGNYVSCWTIGAKDSMAHWQLYGGVKTGVAVTSTIGKLAEMASSWGGDSVIQRVQYVDHLKTKDYLVGGYADVLKFKHEAYRYERELRIVVPRQGAQWASNPPGISLPIPNLSRIVRSVVIAPEADPEFHQAVKGLCARYGLTSPVRRSKLAFVPV